MLVLDDATSSVDARTEEQIHATLREVMTDRTTILIAHRRSTLGWPTASWSSTTARWPTAPTRSCWPAPRPTAALLGGPGDDAEGNDGRRPALDEAVVDRLRRRHRRRPPPSLWIRPATTRRRADARVRGPSGARGDAIGHRRRRRRRRWRGIGGAVGLAPTPELLAAVDTLPPADDDPEVDVDRRGGRERGLPPPRFLRPYRRALLVGFGLVVVDTLLTLAGPFLVQQGLDNGVQHQMESACGSRRRCSSASPSLDWVVTWGYTRYTGRTAERLLFALRIRIFAHLQRLSLDYYDSELSGRIMTRMTTDVDAFAQLLQTGLITALVNILSFVGVLVVLAFLSWPLMLGVLVLVPPLLDRDRVVRAPLGARLRARPRGDRHRQRRVPGEHLGRARGPGLRARGPQHRRRSSDGVDATATRGSRTQRLHALYFPFVLFLADVRRRHRARPRQRPGAQRHHRHGHRHRVPALPRPVLRRRSSSCRRCSTSGSRRSRR